MSPAIAPRALAPARACVGDRADKIRAARIPWETERKSNEIIDFPPVPADTASSAFYAVQNRYIEGLSGLIVDHD
jgi:hypothetical protein